MAVMKVDVPKTDSANGPAMPLYTGGTIPTAYQPIQDPNMQSSLARQLASANKYRENIPQMSDSIYGNYAQSAKQNLAQNLKSVDKDFNRRGLLRSGTRTGAQYGAQADNASDLASARSKINQGLLDTADQMDSGVYNSAANIANTGYNMTGLLTEGAQTGLDAQDAQNAANQALWGSLFKSGGTVAGSYFKNGAKG